MSPFTEEQERWLAADPTSQAWREMAATVAARVMAEHDAERAEADQRCRDPRDHPRRLPLPNRPGDGMTKPTDLKPGDRINADQYRALMALVLEYGDARANLRAGWSTSERADVLLKRIRSGLTDALTGKGED